VSVAITIFWRAGESFGGGSPHPELWSETTRRRQRGKSLLEKKTFKQTNH